SPRRGGGSRTGVRPPPPRSPPAGAPRTACPARRGHTRSRERLTKATLLSRVAQDRRPSERVLSPAVQRLIAGAGVTGFVAAVFDRRMSQSASGRPKGVGSRDKHRRNRSGVFRRQCIFVASFHAVVKHEARIIQPSSE